MTRFFTHPFRAMTPSDPDDETHCRFVSSKGLMKTCETHQPLPNDARDFWPPRRLGRHRDGGRIYVHTTALPDFARRGLKRIRHPFILVSGDSVIELASGSVPPQTLDAILDHPLLVHWHAQNLAHAHPKLSPMALGLDYHSIHRAKRNWGPQATPRAQEELLQVIRRTSPALADRAVLGYCNWHFASKNGDRAQVMDALPSKVATYQPAPLPRSESWLQNAQHFFTISPRGNGMDCHRTWEALLLGACPIIPDLPINALFADLPVVITADWRRLTPAFLDRERQRLLSETFDFAPLFLAYWRARLSGQKTLPSLRMTYQDFMHLQTGDMDGALASVPA